jgi:lipopolysaccharide transport system ATP-binding protein
MREEVEQLFARFRNGGATRDGKLVDESSEFWALKDISFSVRRGEVLGIIGRNGAGKSTLLKILSRITEPTGGTAYIRGRVASLLEVGTGFHPELTGRENIYLNGAILGMTRAEIRTKFDEIVAFAEVERFLDTPVKRYSSGMYVRLAFAVAAHLEPEILIVDEVLAVGDRNFQQKCLGKMHDVASKEGRTVLFVSHNLAAINELAAHALLLELGRIAVDGSVSDVISSYLSKGAAAPIYVAPPDKRAKTPHVRRVEVLASHSNDVHHFGEPLSIKVWIRHEEPMKGGCLSLQVFNQYQQPVIHTFAYNPDVCFGGTPGETILTCQFPSLRLNIGRFHLRVILSGPPNSEIYEMIDGICPFDVVRTDEHVLWGWRPEVCAYHEQHEWIAVNNDVSGSAQRQRGTIRQTQC